MGQYFIGEEPSSLLADSPILDERQQDYKLEDIVLIIMVLQHLKSELQSSTASAPSRDIAFTILALPQPLLSDLTTSSNSRICPPARIVRSSMDTEEDHRTEICLLVSNRQ